MARAAWKRARCTHLASRPGTVALVEDLQVPQPAKAAEARLSLGKLQRRIGHFGTTVSGGHL